jgi:hypothetical protein
VTLYTVPGTGFAQLIVNAGDGPTMVINRDETNQLYVGDDNSVASKNGTGDIDIIDPLSYIVYDGIDTKYAISAVPNASIQVNTVKGATNWAPSPAQAAFQISQLGLATSANQSSQISQGNSIVTNTGATETAVNTVNGTLGAPAQDGTVANVHNILAVGIALPVGAAQDSTVSTVNTTLGSPAQNTSVINQNPYFTGGDTSGWTNFAGTLSSTATPIAGCPSPYAGIIVPNGFSQFIGITSGFIPASPGEVIQQRVAVNIPFTDPNLVQLYLQYQFYDSTHTQIGANQQVNFPLPTTNQWVWLNTAKASVACPANTAFVEVAIVLNASVAFTVAQTFQVAAFTAFTFRPGPPAQDHTVAQIHDRIATTGAPRLNLHNQIGVSSGTVAASTATLFGPFNFNQPGFEIFLTLGMPGGSTAPFPNVVLEWFDSNSSNPVWYEEWYLPAGNNSLAINTYFGRGPCKGNQLKISIGDPDPAQAITYSFNVYQTSTDIPEHSDFRLRSDLGWTIPGLNMPDLVDPAALILGTRSASVGAGANDLTIQLPPYAGKVKIFAFTGSGTTDLQVSITGTTLPTRLAGDNTIWRGKSDANGFLYGEVSLPHGTCGVTMNNGNASARTCQFYVVMEEY